MMIATIDHVSKPRGNLRRQIRNAAHELRLVPEILAKFFSLAVQAGRGFPKPHIACEQNRVGLVIKNRWELGTVIGRGSFGTAYEARDINTGRICVIKVEPEQTSRGFKSEVEVFEKLRTIPKPICGIPQVYDYGSDQKMNFIAMEKLGDSLEKRMRNGQYFSAKSILKFGIQAIRRIRALHELGYVHSDIKPENFLVGDTDPNCIYLIDFGLSRQFIHTTTGEFRSPYAPRYRGTAAYCSLFVNMGYEHARRDDLISLGHTMISLLERNQLPWFSTLRDYLRLVREDPSIENRSRPLHKIAAAAQKATSMEELCHRMPMMQRFFEYLYGLNYEDSPEYEYLERILSDCLASLAADFSNNILAT